MAIKLFIEFKPVNETNVLPCEG